MSTTRYDRTEAIRYAYRHVFAPNPRYANMDMAGGGGDCTNFVSQCLEAGGWRMDYRRTGFDTEWWYRRIGGEDFDMRQDDWWSCTWSVPELFARYLSVNYDHTVNLLAESARIMRRGDVIFYDWDGDGLYNHSALVTSIKNGLPYVTYRTLRPLRPVKDRHWRLAFRGKAYAILGILLPATPEDFGVAPNWNRLAPCDRRRAGSIQRVQEAINERAN